MVLRYIWWAIDIWRSVWSKPASSCKQCVASVTHSWSSENAWLSAFSWGVSSKLMRLSSKSKTYKTIYFGYRCQKYSVFDNVLTSNILYNRNILTQSSRKSEDRRFEDIFDRIFIHWEVISLSMLAVVRVVRHDLPIRDLERMRDWGPSARWV